VSKVFLSQQQFFERERAHPLRQYDVPVTHAISLAVPTLRAGIPGYARFASPAQRVPGKPQVQGIPDRWWIFSAIDGRLICYALYAAFPFAPGYSFDTVELTAPSITIAAIQKRLKDIETLLDLNASLFFECKSGDRTARSRLHELITQQVSELLEPQYRALAPDFFAWLEA
jgi:hypothetical protein